MVFASFCQTLCTHYLVGIYLPLVAIGAKGNVEVVVENALFACHLVLAYLAKLLPLCHVVELAAATPSILQNFSPQLGLQAGQKVNAPFALTA